MKSDSDSLQAENFFQRMLYSMVGRIVVTLMAILAGILAAYTLALLVQDLFPPRSPVPPALEILFMVAVVTGMYLVAARWIERRPLPVDELALPGAGRELGMGLLVGAALATLPIGVLWLLGAYRINEWNGLGMLVPALAVSLPSAYLQELAFRGVILRITEEKMGAFTALLVSSLAPGLLYAANAASPLGILSAALVAGGLMGAAYLLTRRLWLPMGIHIALDFASAGIFGVGPPVSIGPAKRLFEARLSGPELLTGGLAGVEASVVTLVMAAIACAVLYILAEKRWPGLFSD